MRRHIGPDARSGLATIEARQLRKSYGPRTVVHDLDLMCRAGTVLGLLGPNGAGKTTTLRMLYGFAEPDGGQILYGGRDFATHREELKRQIGVCTQEDSLDYDFSVEQNLHVYASYFRPRVPDLKRRVQTLLDRFGLAEYAGESPMVLSGGYMRRLLIARSVVHDPAVLFLDEPTTGLDPSARVDLWALIKSMRDDGMAIVLTTHYMDEAQRLSDDLLVLRDGRSVATGDPDSVVNRMLGEHVMVVSSDEPSLGALLNFVGRSSDEVTQVLSEVRLPVSKEQLSAIGTRFPDATWQIRQPTLDDLFIELARSTDGLAS